MPKPNLLPEESFSSSVEEINSQLKAENLRLQTKIVKLEATVISQKNKIIALQTENENFNKQIHDLISCEGIVKKLVDASNNDIEITD